MPLYSMLHIVNNIVIRFYNFISLNSIKLYIYVKDNLMVVSVSVRIDVEKIKWVIKMLT